MRSKRRRSKLWISTSGPGAVVKRAVNTIRSEKLPKQQTGADHSATGENWLSCWKDVENLPFDALKTLLSVLVRLPFPVPVPTPPLSAIHRAISALLSQGRRKNDGDVDETLESVGLVESVVTWLLKFKWNLEQDGANDAPAELCNSGLPSDCPSCSTARLDTEIRSIESSLSNKKLGLWDQETFRFLPEMTGVTNVTVSLDSKRDFLTRKLKLLRRFKDGLNESSGWVNSLFLPVEIPVYVVLTRKLQEQHIELFDVNDFGGQEILNDIEVHEATKDNLNQLASGGKAVVLFGHLYSVKYLVNPVDIPKKKRKKGSSVNDWVRRKSSYGYDALYRGAKSGNRGGSWIVWQPYALFPVHRVKITNANREAINKSLPDKTQVHEQYLKISFKKPTGTPTPVPSVVADETIDKLRALVATATEVIPQIVEKTLASKLSFVPQKFADSTQSKSPFGGMKYLKSLQAQEKLKEDGELFLVLELLAVRKLKVNETRVKLEEYVTRVCQDEGGYAHPLAIVAIARLAARMSQNQPSNVQHNLIETFDSLYPEASSLWLHEAEVKLTHRPVGQADAVSPIVSNSLSVEGKWESLKSQYGCRSEAMEDLLKLVGLKKVKKAALNVFKNAMRLQQLSSAQRKKNSMAFNYCFVGNPGTGKTTVARLFANVMKDSEDPTKQYLKKAAGGVLFIDEAYELDPVGDFKGKPIVAELLTAAEDKRDDLSIILAGYEDDIQKKLYAYNDGLPSRFEEVVFEDFDAQDLEVIWDGLAQERGWTYDKAIVKVACRRLAKAAGRKGFGNARAVRKLFEQAVKEAWAREDFDGDLEFKTVDLLGDRLSANPKLEVALQEVEEKTGWHTIKEEMKKLVRISDENYERELKGQETVPLCLNRLFLRNSGTGKTTCARYYGRLLKALHFLSNGEVVTKTAGDFIGSHVGESQAKTSQILDMAKGKVLVIDEAYNLNDNMYGKQVLDVLVEKVQGIESDDLAVLLIGYEQEMLEMLRTQNPGLMRRFPPQYAFHFEDYSDHEVLETLEWNCEKRSVTCSFDVAEALLKQLALQKTQPNFGNAGAVEQLLNQAMGKAMNRPMVDGRTVLTLADVGVDEVLKKEKDPIALLDKLYRMDAIKDQLTQLRNEMIVADREGSGMPEVGHFVFRGSPGTGKTTVARVMVDILHGMGVLATTKLVETSGLDLTAEHTGQTKKKVTEKLGEAKGGLLFIDEAYELGKGPYGEEAMTTLVAAMTDPSYIGMVIIISGYPKDMDIMLKRNAGLKSRFTRFIDFPTGNRRTTFSELKKLEGFGNGRDAVRVWKELLQSRAQRVFGWSEDIRTITAKDAVMAGEIILAARRPPDGPLLVLSSVVRDISMFMTQQQLSEVEAIQKHEKEEFSLGEEEVEEVPEMKDNFDKKLNEERDPGVSDEDWEELERAKEAHAAHLESLKNAEEQEKIEEERRCAAEIQDKIHQICPCPAGFNWYKCGSGWRCGGGSHYVSDAQLSSQFTC